MIDRALDFTVEVEITRDGDPFPGGNFTRVAGQVGEASGGSGVIFDSSGLVATNAHVVNGAGRLEVRLRRGRVLAATVVGADHLLDLAVLRLATDEPLPSGSFVDSRRAGPGDPVWALGAPLGYGSTVTAGVVSGHDRTFSQQYAVALLQHDAALNPGSSGGPLINRQGQVIGINTATPPETLFDIGIGLAIPAEVAGPALWRLAREGRIVRGALGLSARGAAMDVSAALGAPRPGVLVESLADNGAARRSGLEVGDLLVRLGQADLWTPVDLARALLFSKPGQVFEAAYFRAGLLKVVEVVLDAGVDLRSTPARPANLGALDPGITLAASDWDGGVAVTAVASGGGGAIYGLRPGDRLRMINGRAPASPRDAAALLLAGSSETALLRVERHGEAAWHLVLPLTRAAAARNPPGRLSDASVGPF